MQNIEAQQEVQNEDASFTNVVAYTTICEAQGCNNRVNNAWSIHRDDGTLEKRYFFCDEHIKIARDGRGFVLRTENNSSTIALCLFDVRKCRLNS
jgi:hypothetical protein